MHSCNKKRLLAGHSQPHIPPADAHLAEEGGELREEGAAKESEPQPLPHQRVERGAAHKLVLQQRARLRDQTGEAQTKLPRRTFRKSMLPCQISNEKFSLEYIDHCEASGGIRFCKKKRY